MFFFIQDFHIDAHKAYFEEKIKAKSSRSKRKKKVAGLPLSQVEFEQLLVNLIIDGMLPISIVSLKAFKQLMHGKIEMPYF